MSPIVPILRTIPLKAYLGAALGLSLLLNYWQWSNAQAADVECKLKLAEQALKSKEEADKRRAEQQDTIDQSATDDEDAERETLADIAAGVENATKRLLDASRANPSPVACRVPVDRVRVVNAALLTARTARPAL